MSTIAPEVAPSGSKPEKTWWRTNISIRAEPSAERHIRGADTVQQCLPDARHYSFKNPRRTRMESGQHSSDHREAEPAADAAQERVDEEELQHDEHELAEAKVM